MAEQKNPQAQPELSLSEQTRIRREKLTNLQAEGQNPFVITRFDWDATSQQIKDNFDAMEGKPVKVAGRLMSKRGMGKVSFCDLQDRDGRIQLYARQDEMDEEVYKKFKKFDIGDIVGVEGEAFRTQRGEMSVRAHNITLLSKSLLPLPEKFHGLQDKELRFRQRYVDLMVNPEVKKNFVIRSQFIKFMRNYLDNMGYMEVETPVLNTIAGGAAARPFITHHNTLDIDMYMRIATELPLKRLIVGGMDRVYEIGRIFRNEGMDPKHNPEFTTVEMYQAYADFHTMMDIAEGILAGAAKEINGSYQVEWMGEQIDLTPGWRRLTMVDAVKEYVGVDFGTITDDAEAVEIEMTIDLAASTAERAGLKIHATEDGAYTYVAYDGQIGRVVVDRQAMANGDRGYRAAPLTDAELASGKLDLRVFVDRGSVEVYVNGGHQVLSSYSYASEGPRAIKLVAESGSLKVDSLKLHHMKSIGLE